MKRTATVLLLVVLVTLTGCLPATVNPMVYDEAMGFPEAWLGEWQALPGTSRECGREPTLILGKSGTKWYAEAKGCDMTFSGRFMASRIPGTAQDSGPGIIAASFPVFTAAGKGDAPFETKNVFFLVQAVENRLYCWDLLNTGLGTLPWHVSAVKKWLTKHADELTPDKAGLIFQRTTTE